MAKVDLKLDWCSHAAAKYAVEHWHYSKRMPMPPWVKVGVWEHARYVGAVIFSRGANNHLLLPYGLTITEGCELTRVALREHQSYVSRIISIAVKMLQRQSPSIRLIVSYADTLEHHYGGIYQASNWIYSGQTAHDWAVVDRNGKRWHSRVVSESGFNVQYGRKTRVIKPSDGCKIILPGKHRYLLPLDAEMRERILPLAKPYPKRAGSADNGTADLQSARGGVIPTSALHIE